METEATRPHRPASRPSNGIRPRPALIAFCALVAVSLPAAEPPPNRVVNGRFERAAEADRERPEGWDRPDGLGVAWLEAGAGRGRAIRLDTAVSERAMVERWKALGIDQWVFPDPKGNAIADTYGLSFYSAPIPVEPNRAYRLTFDLRREGGAGGGAKVWVRGYGELRGERRRLYETVVHCRAPDGEWNTYTQDFHPTRHRPNVTEMRVMLYAYHPPGRYWFDNIRIEAAPDE